MLTVVIGSLDLNIPASRFQPFPFATFVTHHLLTLRTGNIDILLAAFLHSQGCRYILTNFPA
jgi:hypothetical protein